MQPETFKIEVVDNSIIAEVVMNDLIQGMKRRGAERLLEDHVQYLRLEDLQAYDHAAKLLNFYTSGGKSLFELCGLTVSCHLDGFKQLLLHKAQAFIKLDSLSQEGYLQKINEGKKLTSASFPPAPMSRPTRGTGF